MDPSHKSTCLSVFLCPHPQLAADPSGLGFHVDSAHSSSTSHTFFLSSRITVSCSFPDRDLARALWIILAKMARKDWLAHNTSQCRRSEMEVGSKGLPQRDILDGDLTAHFERRINATVGGLL